MNNVDITIVQGANWDDLKLYYPEDLSLGVARGQIRSDFLARSGALLGEFEFAPLVYGAVILPNTTTSVNRTAIVPKLDRDRTARLPLPTTHPWVYDIFVDINGRSIKVASGSVAVVPRVTG